MTSPPSTTPRSSGLLAMLAASLESPRPTILALAPFGESDAGTTRTELPWWEADVFYNPPNEIEREEE